MANLRFATSIFLVLFLLSILLSAQIFWPFATSIVLALVMVSLFSPVHTYCLVLFKNKRVFAATVVTFTLVLVVAMPIGFFTIALSNQALELYHSAQDSDLLNNASQFFAQKNPWMEKLKEFAPSIGIEEPINELINTASKITKSLGLMIYDNLTTLASNIVFIVFDFFITVVLVFTLFIAGPTLRKYLIDLSPLPKSEQESLVTRFREISKAVFLGNGVTSVIEGILGGLGFYFFDVGPGILWGAIIAVAAFLPIVGATVVFVPATILLIVEGEMGLALGFLAYNAAYAFVLEGLIKPKLIGSGSRMHAVLVFLSVLGGIQVFGPLGLFYGPLIITMFMSLVDIYKNHYRKQLMSKA